ncbi:MAG: TRAP transporter TatT component family protein [Fidelibacterota bacterium]
MVISPPPSNPSRIIRPGFVFFLALPLVFSLVFSGCSFRQFVMAGIVGSMEGLEDLYRSEDDPDLVRESMPSNLKMLELLIRQSPNDPKLLLTASRAFTTYGYAFVMTDAEVAMSTDIHKWKRLRERARKLFLRARGYALRALEVKYPGFGRSFQGDPEGTLRSVTRDDVSLLYWTAAAWGSFISASKDDPAAIIELPNVGYFLERALQLDESYDRGAVHELMISYALNRPDEGGAPLEEAHHHFERAVEFSQGRRASVFVTYAESVSVRTQNRKEFSQMLDRALAIDVDEEPSNRLSNIIAQERARRLKGSVDELFY